MEKTLEESISKLLHRHDCVIVPGFGGFIKQFQDARFNKAGQELLPPGATLHFNRSLCMNDGLLANAYAKLCGISYTNALLNINKQAGKWKDELTKNAELELAGIGKMSVGEEDRWQFKPALIPTLAPFGYGLSPVHIQEIAVEEKSNIIQFEKAAGTKTNYKWWLNWRTTAVAAACLFLAIIAILKHDEIKQSYSSFADYPIFQHKEKQEVVVENQPKSDSVFYKDTPVENVKMLPPMQLQTKEEAFTVTDNREFYIIGGSFSKEKNANNFVEQLRLKGFNAEVLYTETGYFRVSYVKHLDSLAANGQLQQIRQNHNQQAWILKW